MSSTYMHNLVLCMHEGIFLVRQVVHLDASFVCSFSSCSFLQQGLVIGILWSLGLFHPLLVILMVTCRVLRHSRRHGGMM